MKLQVLASLVLVSDVYAAAIDAPAAEVAARGEHGRGRQFFNFNWGRPSCGSNFQGQIHVQGEAHGYGNSEDIQRELNKFGVPTGIFQQWQPWLFPPFCTTASASPTAPGLPASKNNAAPTQSPPNLDTALGSSSQSAEGSPGTTGVPGVTVTDDAGGSTTPDSNIGPTSTSTDLQPTLSVDPASSTSLPPVGSSAEVSPPTTLETRAPSSSVEPSQNVASSIQPPISSSANPPPPSSASVNPVPSSELGQSTEGPPTTPSAGVATSSEGLQSSINSAPIINPSGTSSEVVVEPTVIPTSSQVDANSTGTPPPITTSPDVLPTSSNVSEVTSSIPSNVTETTSGQANATTVPPGGLNGTALPTPTPTSENATLPPGATIIPTFTTINGNPVATNAVVTPTVTTINGTAIPTVAPLNSTQIPSNTTALLPMPTIRNNSGSIDNPSVVEGIDKVRGVNLGGWLVYEGWITADGGGFGSGKGWVDEWTMAQSYDQNRDYINAHWQGWVTESDFAQIAAAGMNTVRIPVGYWSFIPTQNGEPYRGRNVTFQMLQQAFGWALKHGLRIMLDMHAVPGPQSLDAHSGHKTDHAGFFFSEENKNRTIQALVEAAREFTQPKYGGVLKSLMLVNEPRLPEVQRDEARAWLKQFYVDAHNTIRALPEPRVKNVTILIHDSFDGADRYGDFRNATGDPNVAMDRHLYAIFEPSKANWTGDAVLRAQCQMATELVNFAKNYYTIMVAEFGAPARGGSCSWFTGVEGMEHPGECPGWGDEPDRITWVKESLLAQLEAYERTAGWVFWTWKTANGDLGWDMQRIIDKVLKGRLGVDRFDQIKLDRCEYYNATMPPLP